MSTPKKKARMGRPPTPAKKKRRRFLSLRVTDAELKAVQAEAERQGVSVGELLMKPWRKED